MVPQLSRVQIGLLLQSGTTKPLHSFFGLRVFSRARIQFWLANHSDLNTLVLGLTKF